ncbi:MAG: hypothetical protein WCZ26_04685, partial [Methanothrix soehngenii]
EPALAALYEVRVISSFRKNLGVAIFSAPTPRRYNAVALKEYLEARMKMPDSLPLDHHSS